jgi:hypothetical protein
MLEEDETILQKIRSERKKIRNSVSENIRERERTNFLEKAVN